MFHYQNLAIQDTGSYTLGTLGVHLDFLYMTLFSVRNLLKEFTWNSLWFIWYFLAKYTIAIEFPISLMLSWPHQIEHGSFDLVTTPFQSFPPMVLPSPLVDVHLFSILIRPPKFQSSC